MGSSVLAPGTMTTTSGPSLIRFIPPATTRTWYTVDVGQDMHCTVWLADTQANPVELAVTLNHQFSQDTLTRVLTMLPGLFKAVERAK